jgi:diaminohydroxyphosphoribosylaminopyrimidine deaminase/5-amino-6-(5-phosphoribosylamino)uracil reductase
VGDPNPQVNGQGAAALAAAGIQVECGLLEEEATALNAGFMKRMRVGRPLVRVKLAMSLDGRTALASGESRWITGEAAREDVQRWRARSSAVVTGVGTVLADDPRLDVRLPDLPSGRPRLQPLRVVLDARLQMPPTARMLTVGGNILIMTAASQVENEVELLARRSKLMERGAAVEEVPASGPGAAGGATHLSLPDVLDQLGRREINELWVEAGARLAGKLLDESLADELVLYMAPKLLGPKGRPLADIADVSQLKDARQLAITETRQIGDDLRIRLRRAGDSAPHGRKAGG